MDRLSYDSLVSAASDDTSAQRSGARDSLLLAAALRLTGLAEPVQVRVRNLSSGGLMAEYAGLVNVGDVVEIEVRGLGWVRGRIAWATDGRIGMAFDKAIDPKAARKPVGTGRKNVSTTAFPRR
ncbi:PilZ domain-containing protein [Sphingomonas sp.]|uniref:PilZ domain-containing protein n=1 Tax=Sphingomonas sp. TaxID=28214 RepID=UPI002BB5A838|nr:PilZ domain-containing protein [Sphingomonas sp.]HWK36023.1 PilZ domain-containing protein [Sphingomonas sp.]